MLCQVTRQVNTTRNTDKHTCRVNFPSSANVYTCKSSIYFFLLSKIYYICLAFQQYKLQFSQKILRNDKECRQFHISRQRRRFHFASCKVTAYFTRVHVVHKCKETWQTRTTLGKKYPNIISKNTDLWGGKHSPDLNTPLKTRQFLWYKNSLRIEPPVNKNGDKSDQKHYTGDLFKPPIQFWEQCTSKNKLPLPLTASIAIVL